MSRFMALKIIFLTIVHTWVNELLKLSSDYGVVVVDFVACNLSSIGFYAILIAGNWAKMGGDSARFSID